MRNTVLLFIALMSFVSYSQGGFLDPSFSDNGIIQPNMSANNQLSKSVAITEDGKILIGAQGYGTGYSDFSILKYNQNGTPDLSFGTNGFILTDIAGYNESSCIVMPLDNGKILASGVYQVAPGYYYDVALIRYNSDGSLDTTFDSDGVVTTDLSDFSEGVRDGKILPDGKILLTVQTDTGTTGDDFVFVRYNSDGTLDATFDSDGIAVVDISGMDNTCYSIKLQDDGKFIAAGTTGWLANADVTIVRMNADGSLDSTFGINGIVTTGYAVGADYGFGVDIQADGKYVVCGRTYNVTNGYDFLLIRYNVDGSLDNSFDSEGIASVSHSDNEDVWSTVHCQADGKIIVSGNSELSSDFDFALGRYNSDGSLDANFGSSGLVTTDIGGSVDMACCSAIQNNDRIVLTGYSENGGNTDITLARYFIKGFANLQVNMSDELFVVPNPTSSEIQIQNLTEPIQSVKIFSMDGREVYYSVESASETIPVSFLETGTYFVIVETAKGTFYSERFIKL